MKVATDMNSWSKILGAGFGAGWLPIAPGTWGSGLGLILMLPFWSWTGAALLPWLLGATLVALLVGVRAAANVYTEWGEDPRQFVLDEVVGMWIAMLGFAVDAWHLVAAFFLFRFFDIFKPLGIRRLERLENGWGVMLDDVAAGVAANLVLWAAQLFFLKNLSG